MEKAEEKIVKDRLNTARSDLSRLETEAKEKKIIIRELEGIISAFSALNGTLTVKSKQVQKQAATDQNKQATPIGRVSIPQRLKLFLKERAPHKFSNHELAEGMADKWSEYKSKDSFEAQVSNTARRLQNSKTVWLGSEQNEKRVWRFWYKNEI